MCKTTNLASLAYRAWRNGESATLECPLAKVDELQARLNAIGVPEDGFMIAPVEDGGEDPCQESGSSPPVRVAVLGAGTVGGGVIERLLAEPSRFNIAAVAVRDPAAHPALIAAGIPLTDDVFEAVETKPDLVIELIGGCRLARQAVERALANGCAVVTANKALLASHPHLLGVVRYSAAVGGGAPMIESVRRWSGLGIARMEGVLNGTSNWLAEQLRGGQHFDDALDEAVRLGLAEADPSGDLHGEDAAYKAAILAHAAWGRPWFARPCRVFPSALPPQGCRWRQIATIEPSCVRVAWRAVGPQSPFFDLPGATCKLVATLRNGQTMGVAGLGAGRYPTTEAVLADVEEAIAAMRSSPFALI